MLASVAATLLILLAAFGLLAMGVLALYLYAKGFEH